MFILSLDYWPFVSINCLYGYTTIFVNKHATDDSEFRMTPLIKLLWFAIDKYQSMWKLPQCCTHWCGEWYIFSSVTEILDRPRVNINFPRGHLQPHQQAITKKNSFPFLKNIHFMIVSLFPWYSEPDVKFKVKSNDKARATKREIKSIWCSQRKERQVTFGLRTKGCTPLT